jgi:hypothetical protein
MKIQDFYHITARILVPVCEVVGLLLPGRELDRQTDSKHFLLVANLFSSKTLRLYLYQGELVLHLGLQFIT